MVGVGAVYLGLRAVDEAGNAGPLANRLSVTLAPPAVIFRDGAEHGLGGWRATGLWHVTTHHAAGGHAAFWYGREDTGAYDTGARNRGALTSPVLDFDSISFRVLDPSRRSPCACHSSTCVSSRITSAAPQARPILRASVPA